jgi:hypothetical protein
MTSFEELADFIRKNSDELKEREKANFLRTLFREGGVDFSSIYPHSHRGARFEEFADFTFAIFQKANFSQATFIK